MRNLWLTVVPAILLAIVALLYVGIGSLFEGGSQDAVAGGHGYSWDKDAPGIGAKEHNLPLPSTKTLSEFQEILFPWVLSRTYDKDLGWSRDKTVRDTGPYVKGKYYGTHPAVRCWYSPKMMYWMTGDPSFWPEGNVKPKAPREGDIPDGAMVIKEMFTPPAARWEGKSKEEIDASLFTPTAPGWTVMIKEKDGAPDGWWWGSVWKDQHIDTPDRFHYPEGGFGMACVRCHCVAKEGGTFSALRNVKGFNGDPLRFFNDETWRDIPKELQPFTMTHGTGLPELAPMSEPGPCLPNAEFLMTFSQTRKVCLEAVRSFPSEANDHVVNKPSDLKHFLTSDQCMGCHSGANSAYAFGPIMFLETEIGGLNVSPYGEWRWSPMGLAGRDPVFHAQLESELSQLKRELGDETGKAYGDQLVNTCLRCHGAMGKRQYDHDQGVGDEYWVEKAKFDPEWYYETDQKSPHNKYGALARDGISCAICHSMVEEYPNIGEFLANSITGQFKVGPPDEVYGPYEDVVVTPMEVATGKKAKHSKFISKSRLCASCHIINLPVVDWPLDKPAPPAPHGHEHEPMPQEEIDQLLASEKNPNFKGFLHRIEQATYLEWLNSKYQDEFGEKTKDARSCQDCHMPNEYHNEDGSIRVDPIITKIATIEDEDYPEADYRIPMKDMTVKLRKEGFRRHTFQGLNVFLAEMFRQHGDVLGVRQGDFETGTKGINFAIKNFTQQARESTARLEITKLSSEEHTIEAEVKVTNLTGHRLPSGVGFRRIFVECVVIDEHHGAERIIWGSGQTNRVGVILGENGEPLPEEFFEEDDEGHQRYHHHHNVITSQNQVQVYEELATNAKGKFTTSFIHRAHHAKENRLLPMGWKREGPSKELPAAFLKATWPGHETDKDPEWQDGSGTDVLTYKITLPDHYDPKKVKVRVRLYSQAWAPYYLKDRFTDIPLGPEGDARRRLYYLASHLKVDGTPIEDWKLKLVEAEAIVGKPLGESAKSKHYEYERKHEPEKAKETEKLLPGYREGKGCG